MTHTQFLALASNRLAEFRDLVPAPGVSVQGRAGQDSLWWVLEWRGDHAGVALDYITPGVGVDEIESRVRVFAALVRREAEKDREASERSWKEVP